MSIITNITSDLPALQCKPVISANKNVSECHEDYPDVLLCHDIYRVILCPDRIQYILQRQRSSNGETQWRNLSYCVSRRALERAWISKTKTEIPVEMASLTEKAPMYFL